MDDNTKELIAVILGILTEFSKVNPSKALAAYKGAQTYMLLKGLIKEAVTLHGALMLAKHEYEE